MSSRIISGVPRIPKVESEARTAGARIENGQRKRERERVKVEEEEEIKKREN